jgi:hypothetical protein
LICPEDNDFTL